MAEKTFTFTIDQIKDIYRAGIRRGEEVQCAHDWGTYTSGGTYCELIGAIHDIINEGKKWEDADYTGYNTVEEWFE